MTRGTNGWYEAIANITGDDSYLWDNMFPYMKKSFNFTPPDLEYRAQNSSANYTIGTYDVPGGPVHLSYPKYAQPLSSYGAQAYAAAGFKANDGFLNGDLLGYSYWPFTLRPDDSTRSTTEVGFLSPTAARTSMKIYQSAMVRNILFDSNKHATGVNVTLNGLKPFTISARKEVIVSSGFIHSPQLLMVSGIGAREHLEKFNISVVSDLPGVGQNLRDTPNVGSIVHSMSLPSSNFFTKDAGSFAAANEMWLTNGSGPLSSPAGDFGGWDKFPSTYTANMSQGTKDFLAHLPSDWPNVEYVLNSNARALSDGSSPGNTGSVACLLTSTTSTGNITLQSASNADAPLLTTGWLNTKEDQEIAVAAYRRAREIASHIPVFGKELSPGANVTTDAQILEYIQKKGITSIHHGAATCAMGRNASAGAVVDSKARVFGVKGLRVIDTSSLPFSAPGHTQGVTYAHAEKLAMDVVDAARGMVYRV
jgi:choline dehydrogenase